MSMPVTAGVDLELPERMKSLPLDPDRHIPVPWFVDWIDGKPEFRAMDGAKYARAIKEKLCWVCGQRLGVNLCFVAGPMCGINRTSVEPPSHVECGQWSARNCPFLSNPRMVRREDEQVNNAAMRESAPGFAIARNPGVAMLWITRQYEVYPDGLGKGGKLILMGEPERVEWYAEGRAATREEVQASIDSGLPNLEALARQEKGGIEALREARARLDKWLPQEQVEGGRGRDGVVMTKTEANTSEIEATVPWSVGSAVILRDSAGWVLLGKRNKSDRFGYWVLPGGTVEPGESLAQTAIREAKEETGLDIFVRRPFGVYAIDEKRIVVFSFAAIESSVWELRAGGDLSEVRFVPPDQLADMPLTPVTRRVLTDAGIMTPQRAAKEGR